MTDQLATVTPILPTLLDALIRGAEQGLDDTAGHTPRDYAHLIVAGVPPESTQPRERQVPCWCCGALTMNQRGACDDPNHYQRPHRAEMLELLSSHGSDS